jgi:hypothetical protein
MQIITHKTKRDEKGNWNLKANHYSHKTKRYAWETTGVVPRQGKFGRRFSSFSAMNAWLDSEEAKKEYKIGWADWVNCVVEVERK